jgi:hypothetical protein
VLVRLPEDEAADQRQREAAGQLARRHPYWLVMYGPHSRRFWAYPVFNVPAGTYVGAEDPAELESRMRVIEMTCLRGMT